MKLSSLLFCLLPLALAPSFVATDASACGGCLVSQTETTQVTGHKMILSVTKDQTTLWDQITYAGDPTSFAWVLPIRGTVTIGLSSDAMFSALEQATNVTVNSPSINCLPADCQGGPPNAGNSAGAGGSGGGGVTVIAQETVGPYDTVQLQSTDPTALQKWLTDNGYFLPPDIAPIVNQYVSDGFNFLALKLVPGMGVDSMRPVRVTSAGGSPSLPLRMVAAGTGQTTPITLIVMGEGRYEPSNFPTFTIDETKLVWDWDSQSSNYSELTQAEFTASKGQSWLVEAGEQFSKYWFQDSLRWSAEFDTANSGYGLDPMGPNALDECNADLDALFSTIPDSTMWITRLHGELSRAALGTDLQLQAAKDQTAVKRWFQVTNAKGTPPACPPPPDWCYPSSSSSSGGDTNPWDDPLGGGKGSTASCAVAPESSLPATFGLVASAFIMSVARRRSRSKRSS